jgi:hypothetical protein
VRGRKDMFSVTQDVVPEDALLKTYRGGLEIARDVLADFAVCGEARGDEIARLTPLRLAAHFYCWDKKGNEIFWGDEFRQSACV